MFECTQWIRSVQDSFYSNKYKSTCIVTHTAMEEGELVDKALLLWKRDEVRKYIESFPENMCLTTHLRVKIIFNCLDIESVEKPCLSSFFERLFNYENFLIPKFNNLKSKLAFSCVLYSNHTLFRRIVHRTYKVCGTHTTKIAPET